MIERPHSQKDIQSRQAMNRRIERFGNVLIVIIIGLAVAMLIATMGRDDANAAVGTNPAPPRYATSVASCYGPGLYGNTTANGTVLTTTTIGVAHRSLPFRTKIEFKHGNRVVRARVIDRGPFIGGRTFDLTHATVRRLGLSSCYSWGVRPVKWRIVR